MGVDAVVFDLFGTLVAAPTAVERSAAAYELADVIGCEVEAVDAYFRSTWWVRHDGTLSTVDELAEHLVEAVSGPPGAVRNVQDALCTLARPRLLPEDSVVAALRSLLSRRLQIGVLSDVSPEIAACWSASPLARLVDRTVFSCRAGTVKPTASLYRQIAFDLRTSLTRTVYVGDGGGDELNGAVSVGMRAAGVRRRGQPDSLSFREGDWRGDVLSSVEDIPSYLVEAV